MTILENLNTILAFVLLALFGYIAISDYRLERCFKKKAEEPSGRR